MVNESPLTQVWYCFARPGARLPKAVRVLVGLVLVCLLAVGEARADLPPISLETVSSGELISPIGLTNAGDASGRLFVIEQRGAIRIIQNGTLLASPFLNIEPPQLVDQRPGFDERGLLGLAFHPNYSQVGSGGEGRFYVYYSAPRPGGDPNNPTNPIDHQSVISESGYALDATTPYRWGWTMVWYGCGSTWVACWTSR